MAKRALILCFAIREQKEIERLLHRLNNIYSLQFDKKCDTSSISSKIGVNSNLISQFTETIVACFRFSLRNKRVFTSEEGYSNDVENGISFCRLLFTIDNTIKE